MITVENKGTDKNRVTLKILGIDTLGVLTYNYKETIRQQRNTWDADK
jgi:hypothetical protein